MKRSLRLLLLIVVLFGIVLWRCPASLIVAFIPVQITQTLQIHQVTGTLWSGRVHFSLQGIPSALNQTWKCHPSLASTEIHCTLQGALTGALKLNVVKYRLETDTPLQALVPVQLQLGGITVAASSQVSLHITQLQTSPSALMISGKLSAREAHYRLGNADIQLGEVSIDCTPIDSHSQCSLLNRGSDARLDGQIILSSQKINGNIQLIPASGSSQMISF